MTLTNTNANHTTNGNANPPLLLNAYTLLPSSSSSDSTCRRQCVERGGDGIVVVDAGGADPATPLLLNDGLSVTTVVSFPLMALLLADALFLAYYIWQWVAVAQYTISHYLLHDSVYAVILTLFVALHTCDFCIYGGDLGLGLASGVALFSWLCVLVFNYRLDYEAHEVSACVFALSAIGAGAYLGLYGVDWVPARWFILIMAVTALVLSIAS